MIVERTRARSALWARTRLVVLDTETTGLHSTARIIAIAIYVVESGVTIDSWSALINPGGRIGAGHIHNLSAEHLASARPFAHHINKLTELLSPTSKDTYVVGHNVTFDAARLAFEFREAGAKLPELRLLDTKTLAPAAGVGSSANSLEELAAAFGISNPAPHEANGDAITTREITTRSIEKLVSDGVTDLSVYALLPWQRVEDSTPEVELTPEHLAAHALALTDKKSREEALTQCLNWSCPDLHRRIEDCVVSGPAARELIAWCCDQLSRSDLTRYQLGLLAVGALRAIEGRRHLLANPKPDLMVTSALAVLGSVSSWEPCGESDQCDRCAASNSERCRFRRTPRKLVWAALYDKDDRVPAPVAMRYLYGTQAKPLGKLSTYDQFRLLHPDAALRGAVAAARTLRAAGERKKALVAVKALWSKGLRSPGLAEVYAAIEEDNAAGSPLTEALGRARDICDEALNGDDGGAAWVRLRARRTRLDRRLNRAIKPPAKNPRNTRPAHKSRFVRP